MANYIILYGVLVITAFQMFLQAEDLILVSRPPVVTYVELGKTLRLNVTYQTTKQVAVTWLKDGQSLYEPSLGSSDKRVSREGQGTLVLVNTTALDNGTYEHKIASLGLPTKVVVITVIIQGCLTKKEWVYIGIRHRNIFLWVPRSAVPI